MELRTYAAAQTPFTVAVNWAQDGWGSSERGFNPYENTVSIDNAAQLTQAWSVVVTPYSNPKPFVEFGQHLFVFDENEGLHAYASTGLPTWTAAPGTTFRFAQASIAASGGLVYVGDSNGLVAAYKYNCRSDGGVCAGPVWNQNIGTAVNGGLTIKGSVLYAPGADGLVHVFSAATGVPGTSITPFYSGAITQAVPIAEDGTVYIVQSNTISVLGPSGGGESFTSGVALSRPAIGNGIAYVTNTDGTLDQVPGGWSTTIGPTGCNVAPAFANSVVYAASCNSIGAYDSNSGAAIWTDSVAAGPQGLAVANGVVYACVGYRLYMYYADYGGLIGDGGPCNGEPEIVNGRLYATDGKLYASTLSGATNTARSAPRPDPRLLKPDPRLHAPRQ